MDNETTFFESDNIAVTNARFIVGAQTFAMRGITSVQAIKIPARYGSSVAIILLGLVLLLVGISEFGFVVGGLGTLLLALGVWHAKKQKPLYAVVLRTAGGEVTAYRSYDWGYISQIIEALNQSIISRG